MKKLLLILLCLPLIFSCGDGDTNKGKKKDEKYSQGVSTPYSVKEKGNENPKLTLIKLIRKNPYNSKGYILESWNGIDKYGKDIWEKGLHLKIDKDIVDEMKKYRDSYVYWDSKDGTLLIDCMIECFKNDIVNCNCKSN